MHLDKRIIAVCVYKGRSTVTCSVMFARLLQSVRQHHVTSLSCSAPWLMETALADR